MGGRCKPLGDEIPLLSWSLHLLGEAEWAVVRAGSLTVFVRGVSLDSCVEARAVLVGRLRDGASVFLLAGRRFGVGLQVRGRGRVEPVTSGSLFGGAIRAEDIAGWGV